MNYESRLKQIMDWNSMLATKEREGREEGRKEGIEKGKKEIIKNLIVKKDWSDEEIAKISELSIDFIRQVREELLSR